jgi:uncharacterized protein YigE (DUF2233 family)
VPRTASGSTAIHRRVHAIRTNARPPRSDPSGFNPESDSRLFRNGVCAPTPDVAIFVNSELPVNFHEFATFFRDALGCTEALFLDGTINSLHSTKLKRSDFRMDLGPIIGVTENLNAALPSQPSAP